MLDPFIFLGEVPTYWLWKTPSFRLLFLFLTQGEIVKIADISYLTLELWIVPVKLPPSHKVAPFHKSLAPPIYPKVSWSTIPPRDGFVFVTTLISDTVRSFIQSLHLEECELHIHDL